MAALLEIERGDNRISRRRARWCTDTSISIFKDRPGSDNAGSWWSWNIVQLKWQKETHNWIIKIDQNPHYMSQGKISSIIIGTKIISIYGRLNSLLFDRATSSTKNISRIVQPPISPRDLRLTRFYDFKSRIYFDYRIYFFFLFLKMVIKYSFVCLFVWLSLGLVYWMILLLYTKKRRRIFYE